jgi:hypothetical protein
MTPSRPQWAASGIIQLEHDAAPVLHEFTFDDVWNGDVGAAKRHLLSVHPTLKNVVVRIRTARSGVAPGSKPQVR